VLNLLKPTLKLIEKNKIDLKKVLKIYTAQRKAKELFLRPYRTLLNVFRLRLDEDEAKNYALSTT